ncbi:MAG: glycosyltransferase family 4 protein [Planctomycetes bacterium]|nr:glycosyltransferase family 4 protein [Planctomycetota bacterium]
MNKRRILLVMIEPPLPFGNAAARWFYVLLKGLAARGHSVTAFASCSRAEDLEPARALFSPPEYDLRCYPCRERRNLVSKWQTLRQPYSYLLPEALCRDLAAELARGFDVLHLEQLWSGWAGLKYPAKAVLNIHYLFSVDLAEAEKRSVADWLRFQRTVWAERQLIRKYPHICTLTPPLTEAVHKINPSAQVYTVPLALDLALYPFGERADKMRDPVVSLIGSFHWQPSYAAGVRLLTRLWPEILRRVPGARLHMVGRGARRVFGRYESLPGVAIFEDVPDARPYFAGSDVLLYAPPRGSGMKVKVLEAFALGTPVVTTATGAEGIPALDGVHASIGEEDEELVGRTVALLNNPEARRRQGQAARRLLETRLNDRNSLDQLEAIYERL